MTRESAIAVIGRKLIDIAEKDWRGCWPVVDDNGTIIDVVDGNDGETTSRGYVYDADNDVYRTSK